MKKLNSNSENGKLGSLLREARATPSLPLRFQDNVWRRIEGAEARNIPLEDRNWLDAVVGWLLRPRRALAVATVLVLIGVGLGWSQGEQRARHDAQARYLAAVAPIRCGKAMKRSPVIVFLTLVAGVVVFVASYVLAHRLCAKHIANSAEDLDWLRQEFQLSAGEMARIRELHDGYLPRCGDMCQQIAAKKRELESALAGTTNVTAQAEQKLSELAALRAQCQTQMLRHFVEVSRAMPPEQGRRYLAEMQRLTLGFHEQIEQSMSDSEGHAHGHH